MFFFTNFFKRKSKQNLKKQQPTKQYIWEEDKKNND